MEQNQGDTRETVTKTSRFIPTAHLNWNVNKAYPSVGAAFGLLGIMLGISAGAGVIAGIIVTFNSHFTSFAIFMSYLVSLGLTLGLGIKFRGNPDFSWKRGSLLLWGMVLVFTVLFIVVREPMFYIFSRFNEMENPYTRNEAFGFFSVITVVIAAPVLEEFVFRGIILDGFLRRQKPFRAIMLSALIFGIAHLNPLQVVNAFLLGIFLGWLYWKTRSLMLCMFLHFVNNLAVTVMDYYAPMSNVASTKQIIGNNWLYAGFYVGSLMIVALIVVMAMVLYRKNTLNWKQHEEVYTGD